MPYPITDLFEAKRLQNYAREDAVLFANGFEPEYYTPTAKGRKRIAVAADSAFGNYRFMVNKLDELVSKFDDPIIYVGGILKESNSYQNNIILGWAKYNHYESHSFPKKTSTQARNELLCNVCTHLAAFHNGEDLDVRLLIELAKEEDLKVKVIPY